MRESPRPRNEPAPRVPVMLPAYLRVGHVDGVRFSNIIADSGSCTSLVSLDMLNRLPAGRSRVEYETPVVDIEAVDGRALVFIGSVLLTVTIDGEGFRHEFRVMDGGRVFLLGVDFLRKYAGTMSFQGPKADARRGSILTLQHDSGRIARMDLVTEGGDGIASVSLLALCAAARPVVYTDKGVEVPAFSQVGVWLPVPKEMESEVVLIEPVERKEGVNRRNISDFLMDF